MSETCRHGHLWAENAIIRANGSRVCRACRLTSSSRSNWKRAGKLTASQLTMLRAIGRGIAVDAVDPTTLRALARRGLIVRSNGRYILTEAGEQTLAAEAAA